MLLDAGSHREAFKTPTENNSHCIISYCTHTSCPHCTAQAAQVLVDYNRVPLAPEHSKHITNNAHWVGLKVPDVAQVILPINPRG